MVWTTFTDNEMGVLARQLFMPVNLLVNYTLLQYLLVVYWKRHKDWRVIFLFLIAAWGVCCLIPFANPDDTLVENLNGVTELCCAITFLI